MGSPVALIDFDCGLDPAWLTDLAVMMTDVSQRLFGLPYPFGWETGSVARVGKGVHDVGPGETVCGFWRTPDAPNALGYHDKGPGGTPILHCFPYLEADPLDWSVTPMHELFERDSNAGLNGLVVGPDGRCRAPEAGDPVEALWWPYTCPSGRVLRCSNWVTPAWFDPPLVDAGSPVVPYDHMRACARFGEVLPGGYQIYYEGGQWTQETHGRMRPYRAALAKTPHSKLARRRAHHATARALHGPTHPSAR